MLKFLRIHLSYCHKNTRICIQFKQIKDKCRTDEEHEEVKEIFKQSNKKKKKQEINKNLQISRESEINKEVVFCLLL